MASSKNWLVKWAPFGNVYWALGSVAVCLLTFTLMTHTIAGFLALSYSLTPRAALLAGVTISAVFALSTVGFIVWVESSVLELIPLYFACIIGCLLLAPIMSRAKQNQEKARRPGTNLNSPPHAIPFVPSSRHLRNSNASPADKRIARIASGP